MSKDQKGFIVYGDIKAVIDELSDSQVSDLFRGMVGYFVDGRDPEFTGILKFVFIPIKQQMDRDADKYEKKCEKMRENINKRWKKNTDEYNGIQKYTNDTNTNTNTNTNTDTNTKTEKETNTNTMSAGTDASSLSLSLIRYLNEKTGSRYTPDMAVNQIWDLLEQGYTEADMRKVIDRKYAEWWNDEKMRDYLRPSTLFGSKFPEYLNAPISLQSERQQKHEENRDSLLKEKAEKTEALKAIRESIEEMKDKDGRIRENITEYRALKDKAAILEDSLKRIDARLGVS